MARAKFLGLIAVPEGQGLITVGVLAVLGVLGGLILNLTPCVLPVIPLKIMAISQHATSPGRSLYLGAWMAAGVVAFWVGIGLPVVLIAAFTDPSQLFGIWWVTAGIGALIAVLSLGLMGLFTLRLPQSVYMLNPKADSAGGSFFFGVLTAVLGLPCFGFVAGALLPATAGMPAWVTLTVFTSLGVGMALPYLILSARPSLAARLPKTGPLSDLIKQVLGLWMLAAAAYFIGSGLVALVQEEPYLGSLLHWWAVALLTLAGGVWLALRVIQIRAGVAARVISLGLALLIPGGAILYAVSATRTARDSFRLQEAARAEADARGGALITTTWSAYSPGVFERARAAGYVVVVDFTADWCINCKVLKATVLSRDPVKSELRRGDVVALTADLTSRRAPGWDKLRGLGQTGIPLLAVYTPGSPTPWLSNAFTPSQVVDALTAARASRSPGFPISGAAGPNARVPSPDRSPEALARAENAAD